MLRQSPDSSKVEAFQSPISCWGTLPKCPFSVWLDLMGNNVCGPLPGPYPQGSCHWLRVWEQLYETEAFLRLPDLNQSHSQETELPIENSTTAKCHGMCVYVWVYVCMCMHIYVPEILIPLLKKKTTHLAKRQSGKKCTVAQIFRMVAQNA